ncbi:hypothetical protein GQ457_11G026690 [Hibiscus cannabinus]
MASARYTLVASRSKWEEQGFHFDDSLPYYNLEQFVYNRLNELGWFRLARQPARANYNWVLEFYANNAEGEDFSIVRGKRVPATAATINALLGLPNDEPIFYALLGGFEEEDFEVIKDFLCQPNTEWNTTGRNPNSVSRPNILPEAKLWNTFVKRNIMPTSHNQTVYRTRLLLINTILTGYKVNIGEILAKELAAACANDKGILAFPCLVSALCRRAAVPTFNEDKYQAEKTGWTKAVYMRKMGLADTTPINMAMPTPPANPTPEADARVEDSTPTSPAGPSNPPTAPAAPAEQQRTPPPSPPVIPVTSQTTTNNPATTPAAPAERNRDKTPDTPLGSTPSTPPSPPSPPAAAQSEEAAPALQIMLLRSQLQRIEARQIHFQEEMKVFQSNLLKFLQFQFPTSATFFGQSSIPPPQPSVSAAAAAQPSTHTSAKEGATEEWQFFGVAIDACFVALLPLEWLGFPARPQDRLPTWFTSYLLWAKFSNYCLGLCRLPTPSRIELHPPYLISPWSRLLHYFPSSFREVNSSLSFVAFFYYILIIADSLLAKLGDLTFTAEEQDAIVVAPDSVAIPAEDFASSLVGKVVSPPTIDGSRLIRQFNSIWKDDKVLNISEINPNFFLISFASPVTNVLKRGPWDFQKYWFVLEQADPNRTIHDFSFLHMCIWVRIHNIPLSLMTAALARVLGASIGKVIMTDTRLEDGNMGEFMRVCVLLDTSKPLRRCVVLSRRDAKASMCPLQYERLPLFCHGCGLIGHPFLLVQLPRRCRGRSSNLVHGCVPPCRSARPFVPVDGFL